VWQLKDLQTRFLDVWQAKDLRARFSDVWPMTGLTGFLNLGEEVVGCQKAYELRQSKHRDMVLHSYSTVKQNRMQICRSPKAEGAMLRAKGFNSRLLQPLKHHRKELSMSATLLYRISACLFVLFALGHTYAS